MTEEIALHVLVEEAGIDYKVRVAKAIAGKSCNALLLKVNHSVPVTDSIEAVRISIQAGCGVMTSHRRISASRARERKLCHKKKQYVFIWFLASTFPFTVVLLLAISVCTAFMYHMLRRTGHTCKYGTLAW